jgi:GTP 3',8-cyclase
MTKRDALDKVLLGIEAALDAGFDPVKVNVVLIRGVNDDEVVDLATFGRDRGVVVRFIEFMPLDASGEWGSDRVVPA